MHDEATMQMFMMQIMYNKIFDEEKWKQVNQENKTIMEDLMISMLSDYNLTFTSFKMAISDSL